MYITINDIIGSKTIDLSYPIKGRHGSVEITVVSMFSNNVQYWLKEPIKVHPQFITHMHLSLHPQFITHMHLSQQIINKNIWKSHRKSVHIGHNCSLLIKKVLEGIDLHLVDN